MELYAVSIDESFRKLRLIVILLQNHAQLKQYLPIIKDSPVYPVMLDSNGVVLSLPPIINGEHSKITLNTKNVFIECTATDLAKAKIVLDTVVCMFSQYCKEKYTIEACEVLYPSEKSPRIYPELKYRTETISEKCVNSYIGIKYVRINWLRNNGRQHKFKSYLSFLIPLLIQSLIYLNFLGNQRKPMLGY